MLCSTELLLADALVACVRISTFFLLWAWFESPGSASWWAFASRRRRAWNLQTHTQCERASARTCTSLNKKKSQTAFKAPRAAESSH